MNNRSYVYELQYPNGTPFYVGHGKGNRCYVHLSDYDPSTNELKKNIINKIRNLGQEPMVRKLFENLYEDEAKILEILLIKYYGRRDIKTGILANLTDGGEGCSGYKASQETRKKQSEKRKLRITTEDTRKKMSDSLADEIFAAYNNDSQNSFSVKERERKEREAGGAR